MLKHAKTCGYLMIICKGLSVSFTVSRVILTGSKLHAQVAQQLDHKVNTLPSFPSHPRSNTMSKKLLFCIAA